MNARELADVLLDDEVGVFEVNGPPAFRLDTQQVTTNWKAVVPELPRDSQWIQEFCAFLGGAHRPSPPVDRPSSWYCPTCNVWGRDMRPAACWSCGTENVDYRVAPSMTGGHQFHEPDEGTSELLPNHDHLPAKPAGEEEAA